MTFVVAKSISTPHKLKNMLDQGGSRTHDLCNASPMLCCFSRSVLACDISKLNLISSEYMTLKHHDYIKDYVDIKELDSFPKYHILEPT